MSNLSSLYKLKSSVFLHLDAYRIGFDYALSPGSKFLVVGVRSSFLIANLTYTCFLAKRAALFLFGSLARFIHPVLVLGYVFSEYRDIFKRLSYHVVSHVRTWIPGLFTNWRVVSSTALRAEGSLQDIGMIFEFPDVMLLLGINDRMDYIVSEARVITMPSIAASDASLDFTRVNYFIPTNYRSFEASNFFLKLFYSLKSEAFNFRIFRYFSVFKNYVRSVYSLRSLKRKLSAIKLVGLSSFLNPGHETTVSPVSVPDDLSTRKLFPFLGYFSHGYMSKRVASMLFFRSILNRLFQKRRRIFLLRSLVRDFGYIGPASTGYRILKRAFQDFFFAGHFFGIQHFGRRQQYPKTVNPNNRFRVLYSMLSTSFGRKFSREVVKRGGKHSSVRRAFRSFKGRLLRLPPGLTSRFRRKAPPLCTDPGSLPLKSLSIFEVFERYRALNRKYPYFSANAIASKYSFMERPVGAPSSFPEYLDMLKIQNPPANNPDRKIGFRLIDRQMLMYARARADGISLRNRTLKRHAPYASKAEYRKMRIARLHAKRKFYARSRYKDDIRGYASRTKSSGYGGSEVFSNPRIAKDLGGKEYRRLGGFNGPAIQEVNRTSSKGPRGFKDLKRFKDDSDFKIPKDSIFFNLPPKNPQSTNIRNQIFKKPLSRDKDIGKVDGSSRRLDKGSVPLLSNSKGRQVKPSSKGPKKGKIVFAGDLTTFRDPRS